MMHRKHWYKLPMSPEVITRIDELTIIDQQRAVKKRFHNWPF